MNSSKLRMCRVRSDVVLSLSRLKLELFETDVSNRETQLDKVQIQLLTLLLMLQPLSLLLP